MDVDPAFASYAAMYSAREDDGFQLPAIPIEKMDKRYLRQIVQDPTGEQPGTIVVDTNDKFLYLVREGGQADPLRRRHRQGRLCLVRTGRCPVEAPLANLDAAG